MNKQGSQMRFSDEEVQLMKNTFAGNEDLLKLIRKVFLPEVDPKAPLGQVIDLWMTVKIEEMTPEQALINIKARNSLISHVDMCLMQLGILAGQKDETVEETKARIAKNSAK